MKRVYCLYRVSTKKQVDVQTDDIPMQKKACHDFAEAQGWAIIKEFSEKGVSGFKVHASDRDAIQDLKKAALDKEFDVLLVFMFDRIGRIDDETPFIVEWFVHNGIEVWSVKEGEQRFDSHVDKLMNYIRFWQASGESAKTSMRIKTRMRQLIEEGCYVKGVPPYGYMLVKRGRLNKKGNEVNDLVVNEAEAPFVKEAFEMCVNEKKGSHVIARTLNEQGARTHTGALFQSNIINRMLANKIYCGYFVTKEVTSPKIDEVALIDEDLWERAQEILEQRKRNNEATRRIPRKTQGQTLLSGNIFCGECGGRLVSTSYKHNYEKKNGEVVCYDSCRYVCYHRTRKLNDCDSDKSYDSRKIDAAIFDVIEKMFAHISDRPETDDIEKQYKIKLSALKTTQKKQTLLLEKLNKQLDKMQLEIANAIMGESAFTPEQISTTIKMIKTQIDDAEQKLSEVNASLEKRKSESEKTLPMYERFASWSKEFRDSTLEQKRAILSELVEKVEVYKGSEIKVVFRMDYEQFCRDWQDELLMTV